MRKYLLHIKDIRSSTSLRMEELKEEEKNGHRSMKEVGYDNIQTKLLCAQLSPLVDRIGRAFVDIAPNFASIAYKEQCLGTDTIQIPRNPVKAEERKESGLQAKGVIECPFSFMPNHLEITALQRAVGRRPGNNIVIHGMFISHADGERLGMPAGSRPPMPNPSIPVVGVPPLPRMPSFPETATISPVLLIYLNFG